MAKDDIATATGSKRASRPVTEAAPRAAGLAGHRVIVFLQENKTTDFYFPSLAAWGAAVDEPRRRCWRAAEFRPAA